MYLLDNNDQFKFYGNIKRYKRLLKNAIEIPIKRHPPGRKWTVPVLMLSPLDAGKNNRKAITTS